MPPKTEHPDFFRLFFDEAQPIVDTLPQGQAQNLLGAMAIYFLFQREPYKLPKPARALFEVHRSRLDKYRRSVLNGTKNKRNFAQNPNENETESERESDTENGSDSEDSHTIYLR